MAASQQFSVEWGAFEIGGSSANTLHLRYPIRWGRDWSKPGRMFFVSFQVAVMGMDEPTFLANAAAFEDEMDSRRRRIHVKANGVTLYDWDPDPAVNSGFNQHAEVEKVGTPGVDGLRARIYDVTLTAELPYDDTDGRGETSTSIEESASGVRVVTMRGDWTAEAGTGALDNYLNRIDAYATTVLDVIDDQAAWELQTPHSPTEMDDQDKRVRWTRVYRELIYNQSETQLDHPDIVGHAVDFQRMTPSPGDSGKNVKRIEQIIGTYVAHVKKGSSIALDDIYKEVIKPFVRAEFIAKYKPTLFGMELQNSTIDPTGSIIHALITFKAAIEPTDVVQSVVTQRIFENSGIELTGAWTGGVFDKYADQGIGRKLRFSIRAVRVLGVFGPTSRVGGGGSASGAKFGGAGEVSPDGDKSTSGFFEGLGEAASERAEGSGSGPKRSGWELMENDSAATTLWIGEPGDDQFAVTDIVETIVEEYHDEPSGGGESGFGFPTAGGDRSGIFT